MREARCWIITILTYRRVLLAARSKDSHVYELQINNLVRLQVTCSVSSLSQSSIMDHVKRLLAYLLKAGHDWTPCLAWAGRLKRVHKLGILAIRQVQKFLSASQ